LPSAVPSSRALSMKKLAGVLLLLVLTVAPAAPQSTSPRVFTSPLLPPRQALDRLNLKLAWHARLPVDSRRDGLISVQVLPRKKGDPRRDQVLVQTAHGTVVALDADRGDTLWRHTVGDPYQAEFALGYNAHAVFALRRAKLFAL